MSTATLVTMEGKAVSALTLSSRDRTITELRWSSGVCVRSLQVPPRNMNIIWDSSWIHVGSFKRVQESSVFYSGISPGHHLLPLMSHTYVVHIIGTEHLKSSLKNSLWYLLYPPPPTLSSDDAFSSAALWHNIPALNRSARALWRGLRLILQSARFILGSDWMKQD